MKTFHEEKKLGALTKIPRRDRPHRFTFKLQCRLKGINVISSSKRGKDRRFCEGNPLQIWQYSEDRFSLSSMKTVCGEAAPIRQILLYSHTGRRQSSVCLSLALLPSFSPFPPPDLSVCGTGCCAKSAVAILVGLGIKGRGERREGEKGRGEAKYCDKI